MKIAVPSKDGLVDNHFGHCDHFTVYTVMDGRISNTEIVASPQGCGCKSGIASVLQEKGVTQMLAGNMGDGAYNVLGRHQISVIRGCSGPTEQLVNLFIKGELTDSARNCGGEGHGHGHGEGHQCQHHQHEHQNS